MTSPQQGNTYSYPYYFLYSYTYVGKNFLACLFSQSPTANITRYRSTKESVEGTQALVKKK